MGTKGKRKRGDEDDISKAEPVAPVAGQEEDRDSDGDEHAAGVVSKENSLKPGDYEIEDLDGNITVVRGKKVMTNEEIESQDDQVVRAAKADKRFDKITAHRRLRFNDILERGKAASKLEHQNLLGFSDDWKGLQKVGKRYSGMIECKFGNYIENGVGLTGIPRIRQISEKELQKLREIDATDSEPCECAICKKRRDNSATVPPASGLRSGKKLGWDKYGSGNSL